LGILSDRRRRVLECAFQFGAPGIRAKGKCEDGSRQVKIAQLVHEAPCTGVNPRPMTRGFDQTLVGDRPLRSKYGRLLQPSTYLVNGWLIVNGFRTGRSPIFVTGRGVRRVLNSNGVTTQQSPRLLAWQSGSGDLVECLPLPISSGIANVRRASAYRGSYSLNDTTQLARNLASLIGPHSFLIR